MPRTWKPSPPLVRRGMMAEPGKRHGCGRAPRRSYGDRWRSTGTAKPGPRGEEAKENNPKFSPSELWPPAGSQGPGPCSCRLCGPAFRGTAEGAFGGANEECPAQTLDCTWKRMSVDANLLLPLTQITGEMYSIQEKGGWHEKNEEAQCRAVLLEWRVNIFVHNLGNVCNMGKVGFRWAWPVVSVRAATYVPAIAGGCNDLKAAPTTKQRWAPRDELSNAQGPWSPAWAQDPGRGLQQTAEGGPCKLSLGLRRRGWNR